MNSRNKRTPKLTPEVINRYKLRKDPDTGKPFTQAKIAEIHDVSPSYVSWIKSQYGGVVKSPKESIDEMWPWNVPAQFERAMVRQYLKDHLIYRATGSTEGWSERRVYLLRQFYRRLIENNEVVEFDPGIEPHEGVFTGGWAFRPRRESDGRLIIRVNQFTKELDDRMRVVWRMPPDLPD